MQPIQWRRGPRPDESVVATAHAVDGAAESGIIRVMGVVTIDPLLKVDFIHAGELDTVKKNLLIAGLQRLILKLDRIPE